MKLRHKVLTKVLTFVVLFIIQFNSLVSMNIHANYFLLSAVKAGDLAQAQMLIANGADINGENNYLINLTPLMKAVYHNKQEMVKLLLDAGADANISTKHGHNALCFAIMRNHKELGQLLVKASNNKSKLSALKLLACNNYENIVLDLVNAGLDINLQDSNGNTALMVATFHCHENSVKALLDAGADFSLKNSQHQTAFSIAKHHAATYTSLSNRKTSQKIGKLILESYIAQKKLQGTLGALRYYLQQQYQLPQEIISYIFLFIPVSFFQHDELEDKAYKAQVPSCP